MTQGKISASKAIEELEQKTHLNRLQIMKIIGGSDQVNVALINSIISISDKTEQQVRAARTRRFLNTPSPTLTSHQAIVRRLSFSVAKRKIEEFTDSQAL